MYDTATELFPPACHLEAYRTNDYAWYFSKKEELGDEQFDKLKNDIYKRIELLMPGRRYPLLHIPEDKQELFVRFACYWIIEHGGIDSCGIEFSSDWKYLLNKNHE